MSEHLLLYTIASSTFMTICPLVYLQHAYESLTEYEKMQSRVSLATLTIVLPIAYGTAFAVLYSIFRDLGIPRKMSDIYVRFIVSGSVAALLLSIVLESMTGIYETWLDIRKPWEVHLLVALYYAIAAHLLGIWMYKHIRDLFSEDPLPFSPIASRSASPSMPNLFADTPSSTRLSKPMHTSSDSSSMSGKSSSGSSLASSSGSSVGSSAGSSAGSSVGSSAGSSVGSSAGSSVGSSDSSSKSAVLFDQLAASSKSR